ncbi:MAG TPA: DUF1648 domain-containing protein [Candidatus Stackebrandtia faecavium]|nr:DUF1648 domain-containing protein [Candidatus Stackebrandtia faecavium]
MRERRRIRARYIGIAAVAPALTTAIGLGFQYAWLDELPAQVATHWSGGGPDGFGPAWQTVLATAGLGLVLPALLAALIVPAINNGTAGTGKVRFMAATCLWTSLFLVGLLTYTLWIQRGLSDPAQASAVGGWPVAIAIAAAALSAAAAFAIPKVKATENGV